jgi:hypothetical protein
MHIKVGLLFNCVSILNMMLPEFFKGSVNYLYGPCFSPVAWFLLLTVKRSARVGDATGMWLLPGQRYDKKGGHCSERKMVC